MNKLKRDRAASCLSKSGKFRAAAINNTNTAKSAQQAHNLSFLPAFLLSRQLAAASMTALFLKGEERISLDASGNGPIQRIFAEAIQVGEVRGYAVYENDIDVSGLNGLADAFGEGLFTVRRILYDKPEPITGVVKLTEGNISGDLAHYFDQSEQIPTGVILDTLFDEEGNITASGGLLVQAMPGASVAEIAEVQRSLEEIDFKEFLTQHLTAEEILKKSLPFEFDIIKNDLVDFFCRCSKAGFIQKLLTLDHDEISGMKKNSENELVCIYCNKHYYLEPQDFDYLINSIKAKRN